MTLTLDLDPRLVEAARRHADAHGTSLDALVADYLAALPLPEAPDAEGKPAPELPEWPRSLRLRKPNVEVTEEDYYRYLEEEHR